MTVSYLVDTDWIIHYLNGQPEIVSKLQELQGRGVAVSLVSLAELYEGLTTPTILRPEKVISMIFLPAFPLSKSTRKLAKFLVGSEADCEPRRKPLLILIY